MMSDDVLRPSFVNCWWNDIPHLDILSRHDMLLLLMGMLFLLCKAYMMLILINSYNSSSPASFTTPASMCPL